MRRHSRGRRINGARRRWRAAWLGLATIIGATILVFGPAGAESEAEFAARRAEMVRAVEEDGLAVARRHGLAPLDQAVLDAMGRVPRHAFVPPSRVRAAYDNRPQAIGYGQTISQPYVVALMTDLLEIEAGDNVFELGTGSGYQAAVLGALGAQVWTVEIVPELAASAAARLARLGYDTVSVRAGDGYYGWPERAPFDAIIVTAAASHIPPPLLTQLKVGGRMVIPVGSPFLTQQLLLIEKAPDGALRTRQILPVIFVPVTGGH